MVSDRDEIRQVCVFVTENFALAVHWVTASDQGQAVVLNLNELILIGLEF